MQIPDKFLKIDPLGTAKPKKWVRHPRHYMNTSTPIADTAAPISPGAIQSDVTDPWTLSDLLDYEFFLEQDEKLRRAGNETSLEKRDRAILLNFTKNTLAPAMQDTPPLRRHWFHRWLEAMRKGDGRPELLPGILVRSLALHAEVAAVFLGILFGISVVKFVHHFYAPLPCDVAVFLGFCILPQTLLVLCAVLFLVGTFGKVRVPIPSIYAVLANLFRPFIFRLVLWGTERVDPADRDRIRSAIGLVTGRLSARRPLLLAPPVLLIQLFGLAYSLAISVCMFMLITASAIDFGWRSSADWVSNKNVYDVARAIAFPWSFMGEGRAYPSLHQVEMSRLDRNGNNPNAIAMVSGLKTSESNPLQSWLHFLLFASIAYGLIPRLALYLYSRYTFQRALAKLVFDDLGSDRLYERLVSSEAGWGSGSKFNEAPPSRASVESLRSDAIDPKVSLPERSCIILASPDIALPANLDQVEDLIRAKRGWAAASHRIAGGSASQDRETLAYLATLKWTDDTPRLFLIQEAFLPPTLGILNFLKACRAVVGPRGRIVIALIGKPEAATFLTSATKDDSEIWMQKVSGLADVNTAVENWI